MWGDTDNHSRRRNVSARKLVLAARSQNLPELTAVEYAPSSVEKNRLTLLLGTGVIVLGCALFAGILLSAGLSHAAMWAISSVAFVVVALPFTAWAVRRSLRLAEDPTVGRTYNYTPQPQATSRH